MHNLQLEKISVYINIILGIEDGFQMPVEHFLLQSVIAMDMRELRNRDMQQMQTQDLMAAAQEVIRRLTPCQEAWQQIQPCTPINHQNLKAFHSVHFFTDGAVKGNEISIAIVCTHHLGALNVAWSFCSHPFESASSASFLGESDGVTKVIEIACSRDITLLKLSCKTMDVVHFHQSSPLDLQAQMADKVRYILSLLSSFMKL